MITKCSRHTIKREDISEAELEITSELCGSYGQGSHKTLAAYCNLKTKRVWFEVFNHRILMLETEDLDAAVEKYNDCP